MYQIPELSKFPKLFHAFSEKGDGNMANSILGKVVNFKKTLNNRKKFLKAVNIDIEKCVCMWVTHGKKIIEPEVNSFGLSMKNYRNAVKVDGMFTAKKGKYLFLLVADCLPIILYDPIKNAVGLIHAGWKGVDLEITKNAVKKMREELDCKVSDILIGIGPCARAESFVKKNPSQKDDPKWQPFLKEVGVNNYKIDLAGFVKKQLMDVGVLERNIFDCEIDTVKDSRFFSHVREKGRPVEEQGRFACLVGMK